MDFVECMEPALAAARECLKINCDVPVGCAVYRQGELLTVAYNTRQQRGDVIGHAELTALSEACRLLGDWRLSDCSLFVTLEPCPMCAGAIAAARIKQLVYGAPRTDGAPSCRQILPEELPVFPGICEKEAADLLKAFFAQRRLPQV